ncbi:hypothetical protein [Cardinium endosymbiont of Philonthus spinipes]|uniref:hypothetical protein n=1 Tax=Cardinium endosymbiont of Philonthus spinipes TaxID=3077941 RepID=UPI00313C584B
MEKQKSPAARASKESVFPNHLQGMRPIPPLFTGAFFYYGHSVKRIRYVWLKKQVASPLPAPASPSIKKWRSSKTLTPEQYIFQRIRKSSV